MISDRPSQEKVVGVARKYLQHEEAGARALAKLDRCNSIDLGFAELAEISYTLGFTALRHLAVLPLHTLRQRVLKAERDAEGWTPGDENIDIYALRVAEALSGSYPYLQDTLRK